jgi:hypothetical protein
MRRRGEAGDVDAVQCRAAAAVESYWRRLGEAPAAVALVAAGPPPLILLLSFSSPRGSIGGGERRKERGSRVCGGRWGFYRRPLGFGARRGVLQGTDTEDCQWQLGRASEATWRPSCGRMLIALGFPARPKAVKGGWPIAGGARQVVTRAGSAGMRGKGCGRSKVEKAEQRGRLRPRER